MFRVWVERKKGQYSHSSKVAVGLRKENRGCRDGGCEKYFVWIMAGAKLPMVQPQLGLGLQLGLGFREG